MHFRDKPFGKKAYELLKGIGLEIGPLYTPFDLDATVFYLDRYSTAELKQIYKNKPFADHIVQVHFISKNDRYDFIDDGAFDFVVNSHVLEHTCNPGRTIGEWLRIVKPGGFVYMVVPHKDYCSDKERMETPVEHLISDYIENVNTIAFTHYVDYFAVESRNRSSQLTMDFIENQFIKQSNLHVHTFTEQSLLKFLKKMISYISFDIYYFEQIGGLHLHVALKKI